MLLNMVASVGFTRPPGTAAFSRGADLLAVVFMLLAGAPQVAARPIMQYDDTNTKSHMCYATEFMPLTDHTIGIDKELTDTCIDDGKDIFAAFWCLCAAFGLLKKCGCFFLLIFSPVASCRPSAPSPSVPEISKVCAVSVG